MVRSDTKPLEVRLFGGPTLLAEGESISLSAYQSALLSVVFGAGARGMTRLDLTRLLWSDGDERLRRRRLSQLLYSLRQKAPPDPIAANGERVRPDLATASSDFDEYERALSAGDLASAASLAGRPFLGDLTEEVTEAFEDWVRAKRLAIRRDLRERASGLWFEAHREARWRQALGAAQTLLRLDPLDEEALRRVILARAMLGQLAEAGAAKHAFEEQYRLEIGEWTPEDETRKLLDRVEASALGEGEGSNEGGDLPEPPLCGRDQELAALTRQILIEEGDGLRLVTVRGEGGMGKTRLVEEALKATRFHQVRVLRARSSEFEQDIPLNPILEALSRPDVGSVVRTLEDPWRRVMLSLMPELHVGPGPLPEIPQIPPGSLPRRLFEAIRQVFLAIAEQGPAVLVLDDFHWADDTSIAVLEYLRRRWGGGGLCVVLALRPEDLGREGSAARFIEALEPLEQSEDIELADLGAAAAARLISELAEGALSSTQADRIAALSGFNPFFVIELTMEALEGRGIPGDDVADLIPVPVSIRQLLAHRLPGLSEQAERLLGLLVVFGRPLRDEELRNASEVTDHGFVSALEDLHRLRLVAHAADGTTVIRHELIRQTVYGQFSDARRAFLHERVAQFLLSTRESPPIDELALHFDRARVRDQAFHFAVQAADAAESSGAIPEALRFLSVARRNTDHEAASTEILWRLAHLHYLHRNLSEAGPLLELAASRLRGQGHTSEALRAEAEKFDSLAHLGSVPEKDLLAEIDRLKGIATRDDEWGVVAILMNTAIHIHHRSNNRRAVRECLDELESYLGRGDQEAQCLMLSSLAAHVFYGIPEKGVSRTKEAVDIARDFGRRDLWLKAVNRYLFTLISHGTFEKMRGMELCNQAKEEASRCGDLMIRYRLHANIGVWYMETGDYQRALSEMTKAMNTLQSTEATHARLNIHYNIGEVYYFLNEVDVAKRHFEEAGSFITPGTPDFYRDLMEAGLGLCDLHGGNLAEANSRERHLKLLQSGWNFNPTLMILFKEKMLLRRGQKRETIALLLNQVSVLSDHFPVLALNLRVRLINLLAKFRMERDLRQRVHGEAVRIADEKHLDHILKAVVD